MPLFRRRAEGPTEDEQQAADVDLQRIREGGIPAGAEQRLRSLAGRSDGVFSSDLSAKEYALAQASGLAPIAQVMGSSVVQHGWQNYSWGGFRGGIQEMRSFAEPWNLSRDLAFDRLRQEASYAGADAVIGIEMVTKPFLDEPANMELIVFGTAVRETTLQRSDPRGPRPRLCALDGQDVDKLRRIGAEIRGVVGHTTVMCVALSPWANQQMGRWWGNQEMTEVTQAVYEARRVVMREIRRQGAELGANDMVIASLDHDIRHQEYEANGYTHHFFIVGMHVLATAVLLGAHEPHPSPLGVPVMSINLSDR